jgi:hypothetical protein
VVTWTTGRSRVPHFRLRPAGTRLGLPPAAGQRRTKRVLLEVEALSAAGVARPARLREGTVHSAPSQMRIGYVSSCCSTRSADKSRRPRSASTSMVYYGSLVAAIYSSFDAAERELELKVSPLGANTDGADGRLLRGAGVARGA